MSAFGRSMLVASFLFLVAGIVWPQQAEMLLRLFVATIALGLVLARAFNSGLPERMTLDSFTPFDGHFGERKPREVPGVIRTLASELGGADDDRTAQRTAIPWDVGRTVIEDASRRLSEHHHLHLDEPTHQEAIRSLVSEPTWLLIGRHAPGAHSHATLTAGDFTVPLSQLDLILDDLERL